MGTHKALGASRQLMLAAACLLFALSGGAAAQPKDEQGSADASAPALPDDKADPDAPQPLLLQPIAAKPLTAADLPPSNPLAGGNFPRTSPSFSRDWRAGSGEYRAIVEREAQAFGLPPALVDAVIAVESRYNPAVIGMDGEIGLMQVMPATARMLGFAGTSEQLASPEINIHYGAKYLAGAWQLAGGDLCTATMKYRAGHGETRFSLLSVDYCMRVRNHLTAQGVAVGGSLPQPTFGRAASGSASATSGRSRALSGGGSVNLAALNAHLRALTERKTVREAP